MADENSYNSAPSLDDIVFENRNRAYGAFDLRSKYRSVLTKSFILGTILFLVVAITPFVIMKIKQMAGEDTTEVNAKLIDILPDEPIVDQPKEEEPPPPPPPPKEEVQEVIQNIVPEPVKAPKVETPPPPISEQLKTTTGTENVEGVRTPTYSPPPPPPGPGKVTTVEVKQVSSTQVYTEVDQSAEYPGGMGALRRYLGENFDTGVVDGDEGKLTAQLKFIVERDGTVSDVKVITKSGTSAFDAEAIRVVKKLKKWSPAKLNGQAVRAYYAIPFTMNFE